VKAIDWDSPVSTEKYALVLIGDRVACFESATADGQWNVTQISGDPWVSLNSHSAQTAGSVLKHLSERRNLKSQLAQTHITLIYEQAAAQHLADVSRAFSELQCTSWEVLRYEPLADRIRLPAGEQLRPHDGAWLAEYLLVQPGSAQPVEDALASAAQSTNGVPGLPDVELLQLYLPLLFQHFWSSISPQDLAFMSGSLQVPDVESPYTEPSLEAIAVLRRRFLKLPAAQRNAVLEFAHELTYRLKVRAQLRDLLEEA
tara:strand:- start:4778 stop:5551 length:774 start_codon:yes stop_codon:yes gene_type:complete